MNDAVLITSAQNSKIRLIKRLRGKRGREIEDRFVIDYRRDLDRALSCGYRVDFLLHCPAFNDQSGDYDAPKHQVTPQIMKQVSYRENPDGLVAIMHSKPRRGLAALASSEASQVIALVDLRVPGNIGALLRTADAAGLDAVILVDTALDLYNPNIIRSSTGACFLDNIFQLTSQQAIGHLQARGFQIIAADASGGATLFDLGFRRRTAIALGAEDRGLGSDWIGNADQLVRIPMAGRLSDSLNVSVSGAIFIYELYRRRQKP